MDCSLCALCLHCCSGTRQMHLGPAVLSRRHVSRSYQQNCVLACGHAQDQNVGRLILILDKVKIVTNLKSMWLNTQKTNQKPINSQTFIYHHIPYMHMIYIHIPSSGSSLSFPLIYGLAHAPLRTLPWREVCAFFASKFSLATRLSLAKDMIQE